MSDQEQETPAVVVHAETAAASGGIGPQAEDSEDSNNAMD